MSVEKKMFQKIQADLNKSTPVVIHRDDNLSKIQKNYNSKYTEDLSDSDDDLSSYKLRNRDVINQMGNNKKETIKAKPKLKQKTIEEEIDEMAMNEKNKDNKGNKGIKNNKSDSVREDDSDSNSKTGSNSDTSDDEGEDEDVEYEYTVELADKVKDYVKNDDRIRELQTELRKLNASKKSAEQEILKHLERLGETNINITGGKLRINQYESKASLKEDIVKEAIKEKIKDPDAIEKIFETIDEKRVAEAKIQISLKRTFERGGKK